MPFPKSPQISGMPSVVNSTQTKSLKQPDVPKFHGPSAKRLESITPRRVAGAIIQGKPKLSI
jgi:hypothetical protein